MRINQLQRIDLRRSLTTLGKDRESAAQMAESDFDRVFCIEAPLRLGIRNSLMTIGLGPRAALRTRTELG